MKKLPIILVIFIFLLVIGVFISVHLKNQPQFAKPVGTLQTTKNEKLQTNINTFMELQKTGHELGSDNYHCANHLFGYDNRYAYALVYCSGVIIISDTERRQGTAFSIPTRLEYKMPNFQIISYKQQGDDNVSPSLEELFPKQMYDLAIKPSRYPEIEKLDREVRDTKKE